MTWSYNPILSTDRDQVRFLIGDTDTNDQLLQNEEIDFVLTEFTDVYQAALMALDVGIAALSRQATSKSVGPLSVSYASRIADMEKARKRIEVLAAKKGAAPTPYAGGISLADKETDEDDTDIERQFRVGMFDVPGGLDPDSDLTTTRDRDRI